MINDRHAKQFQHLWRAKNENRLPHALIFSGVKGTGKAKFADRLTRALLCTAVTPQGEYCNQCHACRLIEGRVHPNILWIEPEKAGAPIKIDQVRLVSDFIQQTSAQGEYRIVIIHPVGEMNSHAANALLKNLEEPSSGALLILINDQQKRLPATILSRCQRIVFPPPEPDELHAWMINQPVRQDLFQALHAIVEGRSDPIKSAASLQSSDITQLLDYLLSWMVDLLKLQLNSESNKLINSDFLPILTSLSNKTKQQHNVKLMEAIQQLRTQVCTGINFNKQLILESLFVQWMECV